MVFQQFNLFSHLTVKENVMIELRFLEVKRKRQKAGSQAAARLLVFMIEQTLSLALRWTATSGPAPCMHVLLTSLHPRLTPSLSAVFWTLCETAKNSGMTMIMVAEIGLPKGPNRVVFMEGGVVVEQGFHDVIFNNPQNLERFDSWRHCVKPILFYN